MKNIFITGVSSGLGQDLCKKYLQTHRVFALSRSSISFQHKNLSFEICDLSILENINMSLQKLLDGVDSIDIAILNAGSMDDIKTMQDTSMQELINILNINTFSSKYIIDFFIQNNIDVTQIIGISSGASINGHKGWGSYCLSKSSLNMLLQLYSKEMPNTHIISLAPGVIETKLVKKIFENTNSKEFPSIQSLKDAPKFSLSEASDNIISNTSALKTYESGSYVDIRDIK